jgi:HK97 family phage portal protein
MPEMNPLGLYEPYRPEQLATKAAPLHPSGDSYLYPYFSYAPRDFDYHRTDPGQNGAVMMCLNWIVRNFPAAPFQVVRRRAGEETPLDDHLLTLKLRRPNGWYSQARLWAGTLLSYNLDGNAYWLKVRKGLGAPPTELWYLPHWCVEPKWDESRTDQYISHYEYQSQGRRVRLDVEDVVHFTNGLDPNNQRKGLSPLKAVLLEVFTDDQAGRYTAALLRNMGIVGAVVRPGAGVTVTPETAEAIKQKFEARTTGDNVGRTVVLGENTEVDYPGFNPQQMDLAQLRKIPETRISGALGIPAIVAGLSAGLDRSTYSNTEQATAAAFEQNLVPTWRALSDDLNAQLLPDFDQNAQRECRFDDSQVKALRESEDARQERARKNFLAGAITLNEFRDQIGMPKEQEGDYYLQPSMAQPQLPEAAMEEIEGQPPPLQLPPAPPEVEGRAYRRAASKGVEWEGLQLRRRPTEVEERSLKAVDAAAAAAAEAIGRTLLDLRENLTEQAAKSLAEMKAADYHTLVLDVPAKARKRLLAQINSAWREGAQQVTRELEASGAKMFLLTPAVKRREDEDEELSELADVTIARVANDVQSRAAGLAATLATLKLAGDAFKSRLRRQLDELSTAPQEQAARMAAHRALADGRRDEMEARKGEIKYYVWSAILDRNLCKPCGELDGREAKRLDDLPETPYEECEGGALCRCYVIAVAK